MSGISGLWNLDGRPVARTDLQSAAEILSRRGPERSELWLGGQIAMGHALLATTPEAAAERLPQVHAASGCAITADIRLDNRDELTALLGLHGGGRDVGDAGIVMLAYLAWGRACVERLLGDFTFAIWDPRANHLFCARDQFGLRPFLYHHALAKRFAFASEAKAVLSFPGVPSRVSKGRIVDYLVGELEGIDFTSTFHEGVYRLPPAHTLTVSGKGLAVSRYWRLEPGSPLKLGSDKEYAEAFLEVFTRSVRSRLRSAGPVGATLSGGMDSNAVAAVARRLLAEDGNSLLQTFSAIGPDAQTCVETRAIQSAIRAGGFQSHTIDHSNLGDLRPELARLAWNQDEPFDTDMTLLRAVYLDAHRRGIKVMLDGACSDIVLNEATYIARLLRAGHWRTAWSELAGQSEYWMGAAPVWRELIRNGRIAFVPAWLRGAGGAIAFRRRNARQQRQLGISDRLAERVRLRERWQTHRSHRTRYSWLSLDEERAEAIIHPDNTTGRERYDRVASSLAIEPRDPFLDRRLVQFSLSLPGRQLMSGGWPKLILRQAMAGLVPEDVVWRRGKQHLGWAFTRSVFGLIENADPNHDGSFDCRSAANREDNLEFILSSQCNHEVLKRVMVARWLRSQYGGT